MSIGRVAATALLSLVVLPAPHLGARSTEPIPTPGPGVCGGRVIMLEDGETLEERTLYFRGNTRVGNADGHNEALTGTPGLTLSAEAPTSSDDKVYVARPTGVVGNPTSNRNPYQGYWWRQQPAPERIVCAGARVFAATVTGQLTVQLWIDQPRGTAGTVTRSVVGVAPANQVSEFVVNF
ncbi:MAG: hypothetical protein M3245_03645, partial [Actinomycetota bacterium]|nr:hypothetical protein [Actinomycetota bacterium]